MVAMIAGAVLLSAERFQAVHVQPHFAEKLAAGPSYALGVTKESLNIEATLDLHSALDAEAEAQAVCMQDPNFREAYEAFKAKRQPRFG